MKVLVTGSSGFVGHHLLEHLGSVGDEVIELDLSVDITDAAVLARAVDSARPEAIIHLAAQASVPASWVDPAGTWLVNASGTVNLLDAAKACTPKPRVLIVSTAEVYGHVGPADLPIHEEQPFAPVSPYAASKAAAELAGVQAWLGSRLEVVRARPFNHTGPGQRADFVVPSLAKQVAEAAHSGGTVSSILTGNLHVRRDITDVRDVVTAYRLVLEDGAPGEVYNICRGESVTIDEVARSLLRLAGLDLSLEVDPARTRRVDLPELRGDPTRLHKATGWVPEIPLEETLRAVLGYWQDLPAAAASTQGLPAAPASTQGLPAAPASTQGLSAAPASAEAERSAH